MTTTAPRRKHIIHVDQRHIRHNTSVDAPELPVMTVLVNGKSPQKAFQLDLVDPKTGKVLAAFKYRHNRPLSCGARVWLETYLDVVPRELDT
jgi:hypothetical protein